MLISSVHQSDTVIPIYIVFHILFHYGLSQDIESGSLGFRVDFVVDPSYITVCLC